MFHLVETSVRASSNPTLAPLRSMEFLWLLSEAAAASVGDADPEASPAPPALLGPSFANRSSMSNVPLEDFEGIITKSTSL